MATNFPDRSKLSADELAYLRQIPSVPPPPGVTPNFVDPPNDKDALNVLSSILLVFMMIFVVNRVYVKTMIVRKYSWDDFTLLIGFLGTLVSIISSYLIVEKSYVGRHSWDVSVGDLLGPKGQQFFINAYITIWVPPLSMGFVKITFFIMFLGIFGQWRWMKICSWIGGVFSALFYTAIVIPLIVLSTPGRHETWGAHMASTTVKTETRFGLAIPATVKTETRFGLAISAVGLPIDLFILILPLIAVSKLQMPGWRKIAIMVVFMTAIFAVLGSILGIVFRAHLLHSQDQFRIYLAVLVAVLMELEVGIMIACMPAMSHTCRHFAPALKSLKSKFTSDTSYLSILSLYKHSRVEKDAGAKLSAPSSTWSYDRQSDEIAGAACPDNAQFATRKDHYERFDERWNKGATKGMGQNLKSNTQGEGEMRDIEKNADGIHLTYEMRHSYH